MDEREVTGNIKQYQTLNVVFCHYRFYFGLKGSRTLNVYFDTLYRESIVISFLPL